MDERVVKVLKMDYVKEEWLVLEIAGAEQATMKTETGLDENVVRDVMRMVMCLFLVGGILVLVAFILEGMRVTVPVWGDTGESSSLSGLPIFLAVVALFVGAFYLAFVVARRNQRTIVIADKTKGTIQVHRMFGNREIKSKYGPPTWNLADVVRVESQTRTVTDSDGQNYDSTDIYVVDKNDQTTKLVEYIAAKPRDNIILHLNAWLRGDEAGPAVFRVPL